MRAVVQRVVSARVEVLNEIVGQCNHGLLVYVGVGSTDDEGHASKLATKLVNLRIFSDEADKMSRSVIDIGGSVLLVPQFTLYANTNGGRRPSFADAARPDHGQLIFDAVVREVRAHVPVATGRFRSHMRVSSINDGPVTITLETE